MWINAAQKDFFPEYDGMVCEVTSMGRQFEGFNGIMNNLKKWCQGYDSSVKDEGQCAGTDQLNMAWDS